MKTISQNENAGTPRGERKKMNRIALVLALAVILPLSLLAQTASAPLPPVPLDTQVRILRVQKDQIIQEARLAQLVQAYNSTKDTISHDDGELRSLRTEALKTAGLDPTKFDLNVDTLVFVPRPAPPAPGLAK